MPLHEITHALTRSLPEIIGVIGICFLMLAVSLVTRWIVIRHFVTHHMQGAAKQQIEEMNLEISELNRTNIKLRSENQHQKLVIKGVEASLHIGDF